jgi:predicted transcriptional regulator
VQDIADAIGMTCVAGSSGMDREVTSGYASDLLSDAMGHAQDGAIWVTSQVHQNVVAVALLLNLSAVVIAGGLSLMEDATAKADARSMAMLSTDLPTFEVVGRLYELGVRGKA